MNIYEIDWRCNSVKRILDTLSDELTDLFGKIDPESPDDALELSDSLRGMAFITAQIYITGTVSDVKNVGSNFMKVKSGLFFTE